MLKKDNRNYFILILLFILSSLLIASGKPKATPPSSSEIQQALNKLNVLGSVLYLAAHPDDENTSVIAYMANGKLVRTAYLSLTRGDGGQNLLGNEKGELLGVLRSQELLSARKMDGGEQFFSRAIDFGYSKTADETLKNWDREKVLYDIIKVIRYFKPDVILTRFSNTQGGHGHHLASAILAEEAFHKAADPNVFPDQLKTLTTWQAKRILWDSWRPNSKAVSVDVGEYNPILGKSYTEISANSRTFHKSQGFGVSPSRESRLSKFNHTSGDTATLDLFEGIDLTWSRVENSVKIQEKITQIINHFNPAVPEESITSLVELYKLLDDHKTSYWITQKKKEVKALLLMVTGLHMEANSWNFSASKGDTVPVRTTIVNRSSYPIKLKNVSTTFEIGDSTYNSILNYNKPIIIKQNNLVPNNIDFTQPYWLKENNNGKMFTVTDENLIGTPDNKPIIESTVVLEINNVKFTFTIPVMYRWNDSIDGEKTRPFIVRPELSLEIANGNYIFADKNSKKIEVSVEAFSDSLVGFLKLDHPQGWIVTPEKINFTLIETGDRKNYSFKIKPTNKAIDGQLTLKAFTDDKIFKQKVIEIDYPHIPIQTVLQNTEAKVLNLDISIVDKNIGYIMGSGDEIPESLVQLGYKVNLLSDDDLDNKDLSVYDVIICGVRAFNTRENLERQQKRLLEFTENGGTWIVQHNTRFGFQAKQIGPYPITARGRDRISEEDAKIEILEPEHQIFNSPNKITDADFNNWVMERGTYLAESWGGKLYPLLSGHDTGEPSKLGGLLYANYGKGVFIFTAMSWFRQLPAGVPGAYRLFVNIISAEGKK